MNATRHEAKQALSELYRRYSRSLLAYAVLLGSDRSMAEDVVHSIFLSMFRIILKSGLPEDARSYLYQSLRHEVSRRGRDRIKTNTGLAVQIMDERVLRSRSTTIDAEVSEALVNVVGALPMEQREVVELHCFHDMTFDHIGRVLQISTNTVKSRYRLGIDKIRLRLIPPT